MSELQEVKKRILHLAAHDNRIRAVLLNGSRANPNIEPDPYQDFDLVFVVDDLEGFLIDRDWLYQLGSPLLQQLPDEMILGNEEREKKASFTFLTIFEDGNRIDLTLFAREKLDTEFKTDSLTIVWADKDDLFGQIPASSDKDYHIKKPDQQEFSEVCNEFWWTATYVAKGLKRKQIIYAKDMMERVVRPMFLKMIEWKTGCEHDFSISVGKSAKWAHQFLDASFYHDVLKTYVDADIESNWNALLLMAEIFRDEEYKLAEKLMLQSNITEAENALKYIGLLRYE